MRKRPATEGALRRWLTTRDMALIPLFALLVGVGAHIRIPLPFTPVPLTLQTAMVMLTGLLLGSRRGACALGMYLAMGLLGFPILTQGGGLHNLLSPTFGFAVGFIPASWAVGRVVELAENRLQRATEGWRSFALRALSCFIGMLIYDGVGVLWLHGNLKYVMGQGMPFSQTVAVGILPFLLPDLLKLLVVVSLVSLVSNRLSRGEIPQV